MHSLLRLDLDDYIADVLPDSFELWADGRTFERYASDLRALAATRYGERRFALIGLRDEQRIVASLKRYDRDLRWDERSLRACGIGAVFVRPDQRGKQRSHALLDRLLRSERERGIDLAFLFSDIGATHYEAAGFEALPARTFTLRTTSLPSLPIEPAPFSPRDWRSIARCFDAAPAHSLPMLKRTPLVWNWFAERDAEHADGVTRVRLTRGAECIAYVVGRPHAASGAFVLDECGADPQRGKDLLAPLIRHAAGNSGHVHGWLPPPAMRALLPQGSVKRRAQGLPMIAPLSAAAKRLWKRHRDAMLSAEGDLFWWFDHV